MIRTRDVFVLAIALVLISMGILITLLARPDTFSPTAHLLLSSQNEREFSAESAHVEKNRNETIERLRSLIARGETTITPSPSVETVTTPTPEGATATTTDVDESSLVSCGGDDTATLKSLWPEGVKMSTEKGERIVFIELASELPASQATTSSTTPPTSTQTKQLLVTRAFPVKGSAAQCVPGSVVGVTASGGLIINDATFYTEYGAQSLIGYARDGFPIYGFYEGETDACGGYQHVNGYRYTLTKGRGTVLNCYFSTPSSFTL